MISYGSPICQVNNNKAALFCCSDSCTLPAFACSRECLFSQKGHENHRTMMWSSIEQEIRQAMERQLSKEELRQLEKSAFQLKIIIEELENIKSKNTKSILERVWAAESFSQLSDQLVNNNNHTSEVSFVIVALCCTDSQLHSRYTSVSRFVDLQLEKGKSN